MCTLPIPVWVLLVLALAPPNHCAAITAELRPNADVGVAFNDTPQGVFDVFVSLSRPEGWWIVTNEQSSVAVDKSGATIWNRIQASESLHRWEGVGSAGDCWSGVRFHGQLKKPGPEGQPPTFDASVADIDIDVDSLGTRSGDHWPPSGSYLEDSAEAVEGGGLYLPPSLITGSFPSELPPDSSYKLLNLTLRPKWVGPPNPGTVGDLAFSVTPPGVALYRVSNGSRVSGAIRVPAGGFSGEQFAILTNENFTTAGGVYATFTWDSYLRGGEYGATDYVRVARDLPPVFDPDAQDLLYSLDEDVPAGTSMFSLGQELGQLHATDPEGEPVYYGSASSSYFSVNPTTGVVSIANPEGLEQYLSTSDNVSLQVFANDGINPNVFGQFVLGKSTGGIPQAYIDLTDSANNHYTPDTAAQLITNLNTIKTNGDHVTVLIIKGHGSEEAISVGTDDDWLAVVGNGVIMVGDTDATQLLKDTTGNNSAIKLRGCHSLPLAESVQDALDNGTTVYGARGFVIGIPGTPWGIGWYQQQ